MCVCESCEPKRTTRPEQLHINPEVEEKENIDTQEIKEIKGGKSEQVDKSMIR